MGSLVMSQVAPGLGQHSYHHMMVGGNTPHHDGDDETTSHNHSNHATPHNNSATSDQTQTTTPTQPHATSTATPQETRPSQRPPPSQRNSSYSVNNHSRGFDQSGFPLTNDARFLQSSPSSPRLQPTFRSTRSLGGSEATSPSRIKIRDLSHIQSFASEEYLARPRLPSRTGSFESIRQYEISSMPVTDIIEMVAGLLTKITNTNDRQHEHLQRPFNAAQENGGLNQQGSCVLAFHGKNVPSITILSYLSRIHKYCPTTYEVFLSLLVYFDRMTEIFNKKSTPSESETSGSSDTQSTPTEEIQSPMAVDGASVGEGIQRPDSSQVFVVDSYNIHRLVIAGVTCASKFFSDVFYTNSRYAKVGGLPLVELNNLELQFLLLNDFRLSIPVEELEAYGTMLVEFYAREIVAQQQHSQPARSTHSGDEGSTARLTASKGTSNVLSVWGPTWTN